MLRDISTLAKNSVSATHELSKIAQTWKSMEDRRKFLDKVAIELNIKKASDWGRVTSKQFFEFGGAGLLFNYYNGSVFDCLTSVCKGISPWKYFKFEKKLNGKESGLSNTLGHTGSRWKTKGYF